MFEPLLGVRRLPRFVVVVAVLAVLYLAIDAVQLQLVHQAGIRGWLGGNPDTELDEKAREIAELSAASEAALPPEHRVNAWGLGLRLGYLSQWLGGYGKQPEDTMRELRKPVEPLLEEAQEIASQLGVEPVDVMPVHTTGQFSRLKARLESDEWGLATRLEAATSPRSRHLFQLGLHVGVMIASLESELELLPLPPSSQIRFHATLAGVPSELWMPLARLDTAGDWAHTRSRYHAAMQRLQEELVRELGNHP